MTIDNDFAEQAFFGWRKVRGPTDVGLLGRSILSHFIMVLHFTPQECP